MSRPDSTPSFHPLPALEGWRAAFMTHLTERLEHGGWRGPVYHLGMMPQV